MSLPEIAHVVDSHTEGEPTRVVLGDFPPLGNGPLTERLQRFRSVFDDFRSAILCEPRGSDVLVGALLLNPIQPDSAAAVLFFNSVGYLGMCGHGTIGVVTTLAHLGRIQQGTVQLETPVGTVSACLHHDGSVTVANVPSYRYRAAVSVPVPGYGSMTGDIAWGGNWFFLSPNAPCALDSANSAELMAASIALRNALQANGITGESGAEIDHIEFFSAPADPANSARNFVLCPGSAFDRSPCGTGTSAKMACLFADGKLAPGQTWRQEGILGTVFHGSIEAAPSGRVHPSIRGRAWITGESTLRFHPTDPFAAGIRL